MKNTFFSLLCILLLMGCQSNENPFDATGTFEATEIIVSAEVNGKVLRFDAEEGDVLKKGQVMAQVDVLSLELQKAQVSANIDAIGQRKNEAEPQVAVLREQVSATDAQVGTMRTQLSVVQKEQARIVKLFQAEAATQQQLDKINGEVEILLQKIKASESQKNILQAQMDAAVRMVAIQNRGVNSGKKPLQKQIEQIEDQMKRAQVINPEAGTLLTQYIQANEFVGVGKPLYKLADLSEMTLRAYITGDQLALIKTSDQVAVLVDAGPEAYKEYLGTIKWISAKAEFTPKTIQTKKERTNLVYAIKVAVPNDGYLKIGMYGEVNFNKDQKESAQ